MICLFLAVLELVKLQAVGLTQRRCVRRDRAEARLKAFDESRRLRRRQLAAIEARISLNR